MSQLTAHIIPRDEHPVSRKNISPSALKVMYRLENAGFKAFLVGGAVRDMLLGIQPKDFDIATNAHPEQVHKLFSNSRLIGRRFKLVHILFGREIIEVATFRSSGEQLQNDQGMLVRDNVYGDIEEDVVRRDFTTNALYYSATDFAIYDYVDALKDIENRQLKLIGIPEERYREDPVRMLRAVRFAAKLDFAIETQAEEKITELAHLMQMVAPARLFDEIIKLFVSGKGGRIYQYLKHHKLFDSLFPHVADTLRNNAQSAYYDAFITAGLVNTDKRIQVDKPVTPAFMYAVLLWPEVHRIWQQKISEGTSEFPAMQQAGYEATQAQLPFIMITKRFLLMMKEIWEMQLRLTKNNERRAKQLIHNPRFRAGYDFLLLREQAGEQLEGLGEWWTHFQESNPVPKSSTKSRTGKERFRPRRPANKAGKRPRS